MSIKFDGSSFVMRGIDLVMYKAKVGSLGLKTVLLGVFKGVKIEKKDYTELRQRSRECAIAKRMYSAKQIHERSVGHAFRVDEQKNSVSGKDFEEERSPDEVDLIDSRRNCEDFSKETHNLRLIQSFLFNRIKKEFIANSMSLSTLDDKSSSEVMHTLERLNIMGEKDMGMIKKYLKDELDTSPFWK